jgi:beta-lactamase class A
VFARDRAATLLRYLVMLADLRLPGAADTLRTAAAQQHRSQMPRLLPPAPGGPSALMVAHKPGSDAGTRVDLGIVEGMGRRFAFVMMVKDCADRGFAFDHPAERLIAECCRITFDGLAPGA